MPAPAGLRRASITATIAGGEQMVHSFWYVNVANGAAAFALQDHADKIRTAWTAALVTVYGGTSLASGMHTSTVYNDVKLYDINPIDGKTSDLASSLFDVTAKGASGTASPNQVALAVTLETGKPGRQNKGRFYLGGLSSALFGAANGRAPIGNLPLYSQAIATFLQASRDQTADIDAYRAVVYSRVGVKTNTITRVSIGDVFDVQRRRRNGLVEARGGFTVPGE